MFIITNNYEIRITKGSDSGQFPIILNTGTNYDPEYYEFPEAVYVGGKTPEIKYVDIDTAKFKSMVETDGLHSFYYLYEQWYLEGKPVELEDYGLTCCGTLQNESAFSVITTNSKDFVSFYIIEVNAPREDWLVKKTFYKSGEIVTEYADRMPDKVVVDSILDTDGNMNLSIDGKDTMWLEPGLYNYFVVVSLRNPKTNKNEACTVTNRLPFYIIDDDFDRRWE